MWTHRLEEYSVIVNSESRVIISSLSAALALSPLTPSGLPIGAKEALIGSFYMDTTIWTP